MDPGFEQRLSRSPVLPAAAALYLLAAAEPFADGNAVAFVFLLACGFWLTYACSRFARSGGIINWLSGK